MAAIVSFIALNLFVVGLTWLRSRRVSDEYFLGRRRLSVPLVALAVLMTNFSTEQLLGLNGDSFRNGVSAIAWETFGVLGIAAFACVFLPRYYAAGVTTIPQYVERRCGGLVRRVVCLLMLLSVVLVGLPFVLYSGSLAMVGIFDLSNLPLVPRGGALSLTAFVLGASGLAYALSGGMRGIAVSDLFYSVIFFMAASAIPVLGLCALGDGAFFAGARRLLAARPEAFDPFGGAGQGIPASALLTGMITINLSAWCANQSCAQKAFAARDLASGQKGMLLAAGVKLLAPLFFVLPGLIAWALFKESVPHPDLCYAFLVKRLLPDWFAGFFATAVAGATITSVSGLVHSATTLFDLDLNSVRRNVGGRLTRSGFWFGVASVVIAIIAVPLIARQQSGFFVLMKRLNATLTLPVVSLVVPVVMTNLRWRPVAVLSAMLSASGLYLLADLWLREAMAERLPLHWLHSVAFAFFGALGLLLLCGRGEVAPVRMDETPRGWRFAPWASGLLAVGVIVLYGGLWWLSKVASG